MMATMEQTAMMMLTITTNMMIMTARLNLNITTMLMLAIFLVDIIQMMQTTKQTKIMTPTTQEWQIPQE
eukprot:15167007-Ditylum_brightwellii.AAC.1